jgi:hypothetical protein
VLAAARPAPTRGRRFPRGGAIESPSRGGTWILLATQTLSRPFTPIREAKAMRPLFPGNAPEVAVDPVARSRAPASSATAAWCPTDLPNLHFQVGPITPEAFVSLRSPVPFALMIWTRASADCGGSTGAARVVAGWSVDRVRPPRTRRRRDLRRPARSYGPSPCRIRERSGVVARRETTRHHPRGRRNLSHDDRPRCGH